jgi:glutamyl-tRNA reductase
MSLLAFGVNHHTAPLRLRERVSIIPDAMPEVLTRLRSESGVAEAAILSTCNRTEVYCSLGITEQQSVIDWFSRFHGLALRQLEPHLYAHPDARAVKHVMRVASGLDSMVIGEPQVLGQLKSAYVTAVRAGSVGNLLNRLFQHSFSVAKQVRSRTAIGNHPVSIAFAAVRLAQQIFGPLGDYTGMLVGAGETIELAARHLRKNGLARLIIANRSLDRAQALAREFGAYAIPLTDIARHIAEADIIVIATTSPAPIIDRALMETAVASRKHRPVFIADLAVPRDVDPQTGELPDVYLYTVDDLRTIIHDNLRNRQQAALQAEEIIDVQVVNFMDWMLSRDAVSAIRALRGQAEDLRQEVAEWALSRLRQGADPELLIREASRVLTNKLLHEPTVQLRKAGTRGRGDLLEAARELFHLKEDRGR